MVIRTMRIRWKRSRLLKFIEIERMILENKPFLQVTKLSELTDVQISYIFLIIFLRMMIYLFICN